MNRKHSAHQQWHGMAKEGISKWGGNSGSGEWSPAYPLKTIVIAVKRPSPYFSDLLLCISCPVCGDVKQPFMTAPPILGIEWASWLLLGVAPAVAVRWRWDWNLLKVQLSTPVPTCELSKWLGLWHLSFNCLIVQFIVQWTMFSVSVSQILRRIYLH